MVCEEIKFALLDTVLGLAPIDWHARLVEEKRQALSHQDVDLKSCLTCTYPVSSVSARQMRSALVGTYHCPGFHECIIGEEHVLDRVPELVRLPWLPYIWGEMQPVFCIRGERVGLCWRYTLREEGGDNPKYVFGMPAHLELDLAQDGLKGIGLRHIWGAGEGIPSPTGETVKARAEVYLEMVA